MGYLRRSEAYLEAGVKYLVAGGLSSALLLMGIVLVYGALGSVAGVTDSLNFTQIGKALAASGGRRGLAAHPRGRRRHPRRRGLQARRVPLPRVDP
jgi:NADH:ubiquinone oxidoreductase subunit 2 (subunit N)